MAECIFCKISKGEIPANIIFDSPDVIAFLDIRPANPGHTLVVPKQHITYLPQMPDEMNARVMQLIKVITQAQIEVLEAQGVNVLQNNGQIAGQVVPHVHFHVIPRFKDDKVSITWEPTEISQEQFKEIQNRLQNKAKEIAEAIAGKAPITPQTRPAEAPKEPVTPQKKAKVKPRLP